MSDQCRHCTVRGDLAACEATPCGHHDNWYAVALHDEIARLETEAKVMRRALENQCRNTECPLENLPFDAPLPEWCSLDEDTDSCDYYGREHEGRCYALMMIDAARAELEE